MKKLIGIIIILTTIVFLIIKPMYKMYITNNVNNTDKNISPEETLQKILENYETETNKKYNDEAYKKSLSILDEFFNYINEKNYKKAYNMIDKNFIKNHNYTLEKMIKNHKFENNHIEKTFAVNNIKKLKDSSYCAKIQIMDFEEDMLKENIKKNIGGGKIYEKVYTIYPSTHKIAEIRLIENEIKVLRR